jgi:SAM-dependent methyltransferase
MPTKQQKDFLWLNLKDLPYFRALLRAVEASYYQNLPLAAPVLDLGCGDGHFASIAFDQPIEVGLDPWRSQLGLAARTGAYRLVLQGDGGEMPFPSGHFRTVISNSVLEHIPNVDTVIKEVARVLKPGGKFIFCVPNHHFTHNLSVSRFLIRAGLDGMAAGYRNWFNKISRHQHCDSQETWFERLAENHIVIDRAWDYFSPGALRVLEWGHYFGLPALIANKLSGHWILVPTRWNLGWIEKRLRAYYQEQIEQPLGSYTFYITTKQP